MSADSFIDTNVLIYMFDDSDPAKQERAALLVSRFLEDGTGCISYQVVQETLNVLIQKAGASHDAIDHLLETVLLPLWKIYPSESLYRRGLDVRARYGFSFYDSLIVAAALEAGCSRLYTEDLQDGQRIGELTIVNPFGV